MGLQRLGHEWVTNTHTHTHTHTYTNKGVGDKPQILSNLLFELGMFYFLFLNLFYWSIVDLQCCVNFCCVAKWFSYPLCCAQSHPTLCDSMDCSPQDSSVHGDAPGKNTEVGWHALLQGIFSIQESNPGLLHYFFIVWATRVYVCMYVYIYICVYIHTHIFLFIFFSIMVYHRILNIVSCATQ